MRQEDLDRINTENQKVLTELSIDPNQVNVAIGKILNKWGYTHPKQFLNDCFNALHAPNGRISNQWSKANDDIMELMNLLNIQAKIQTKAQEDITLEDLIELKLKESSRLTEMLISYSIFTEPDRKKLRVNIRKLLRKILRNTVLEFRRNIFTAFNLIIKYPEIRMEMVLSYRSHRRPYSEHRYAFIQFTIRRITMRFDGTHQSLT